MNKNKLLYETPVVKTLVVRVEGVLMYSGGLRGFTEDDGNDTVVNQSSGWNFGN